MFVAQSRFTVAPEMVEPVRQAFRDRPDEIRSVPGFIRMDVCSPLDSPAEFWLTTFWSDEQSFHTWHRSDDFRRAHRRLPRGLKVLRGSFSLRFLETIGD